MNYLNVLIKMFRDSPLPQAGGTGLKQPQTACLRLCSGGLMDTMQTIHICKPNLTDKHIATVRCCNCRYSS